MTSNTTNHEDVLDQLYELEMMITKQIRYESYEGITTRSLCSDCKKGLARRYRCVECLNATLDNIRSEIASMEATTMTDSTTNRGKKWKRIVQFEGGAKTSMPPEFLRGLRDYRTEKCKWRITYEEMKEQ